MEKTLLLLAPSVEIEEEEEKEFDCDTCEDTRHVAEYYFDHIITSKCPDCCIDDTDMTGATLGDR